MKLLQRSKANYTHQAQIEIKAKIRHHREVEQSNRDRKKKKAFFHSMLTRISCFITLLHKWASWISVTKCVFPKLSKKKKDSNRINHEPYYTAYVIYVWISIHRLYYNNQHDSMKYWTISISMLCYVSNTVAYL